MANYRKEDYQIVRVYKDGRVVIKCTDGTSHVIFKNSMETEQDFLDVKSSIESEMESRSKQDVVEYVSDVINISK